MDNPNFELRSRCCLHIESRFQIFRFIAKNKMKFLSFLVTLYSAKKTCDDEDKRIECEGLELFLFILNAI